MDFYNFEEHISAYIDGELSDQDKKEFEELIESNSEYRQKYEEINSLVVNLKTIPKLKTSEDFTSVLNRRIDSLNQPKISISRIFEKYFVPSSTNPVLGFSMSFAAILVISYLYLNGNQSDVASAPLETNHENEIYYSDIDSTESNEYEDKIQLTNGSE